MASRAAAIRGVGSQRPNPSLQPPKPDRVRTTTPIPPRNRSETVSLVDTPRGRWIRMRMGILCGLLAFGLGLVVSAGYDLMVKDGEAWRELADQQRQRRVHIVPKRGTVYDRNGSAVAVSVEVPSVSLDAIELLRGVAPQQIPVVARDTANRVAQMLALDPAMVEKKILAKRRFAWL